MKSRNGFVSNSSTSSFVVIGFILDKPLDDEQFVLAAYPKEKIDAAIARGRERKGDKFSMDRCYSNFIGDYFNSGEHNFVYMDNEENGAPKDKCVFGINVANWTDDGEGECETIEDLEKLLVELADAKKKFGLVGGVPKIFVGTKMS